MNCLEHSICIISGCGSKQDVLELSTLPSICMVRNQLWTFQKLGSHTLSFHNLFLKLNYWVIWFWIPNLGTPQPILPYPKYPLENGLINNPPLRSLPCLSNLASDLLATKTFVNSWELSRPFLKFRRKEMWVSRGQDKELKQGREESIYGSLMAKLWHFQTPSCAVYGNMGYQVFKGGIQNQIDFGQKSILSKEFIVFC